METLTNFRKFPYPPPGPYLNPSVNQFVKDFQSWSEKLYLAIAGTTFVPVFVVNAAKTFLYSSDVIQVYYS